MTTSKELEVQLPTDRAIVRRYSESIARSPMDIKRGEAVFLDRRGAAIGRPRFARLVFAFQVGSLGALIGGGALAISGAWLSGSLLYFTGLAPTLFTRYRGTGKLMAIGVLSRQGHLDEAQRRLDAVPGLRRRNAAAYGGLAGTLASHRGDYATALTWWRQAFPRSKGLNRELLRLAIVQALLLSERTEDAQREFDAVAFPPGADEALTGVSLTKAMFVLCDPATAMPPAEDLHDRARRALAYSHTGIELAALGWIFERSGDAEMASFLATEAVDRMHYPYLATWWPALQQWLDGHAPKPEAAEQA